MQGDPKVIEYLQGALKKELTAINQYFLHSRMLYDWGLDKLGAKEYEESIEEMQHADQMIQRILFLDALPNLQDLERLRIGENVREILEGDLAGEADSLAYYREAVKACEKAGDYATRDMFSRLVGEEEEHYDFLETQLALIDQVGLENYHQQMMADRFGKE